MQLALRQICWPLSHLLGEALGTRATQTHENCWLIAAASLTRTLLCVFSGLLRRTGCKALSHQSELLSPKVCFYGEHCSLWTGIQRFTHVKVFSSSSEEARVTDGDRSSEFTYRGCQLEFISKVLTECVFWQSWWGTTGTTHHTSYTIKFLLLDVFRQKKMWLLCGEKTNLLLRVSKRYLSVI